MNLTSEIFDSMAALDKGYMIPIKSLPSQYPAFVFRREKSYGVAIEIRDDIVVAECFTNAQIKAELMVMPGGITKNYLVLSSGRESVREQFATLCTEFVFPGKNGERRNLLLNDPLAWWKDWSELMGNALKNSSPYEVLGEMITLIYLLRNGKDPKWIGPYSGVKDIAAMDGYYEVKSTINRYESNIMISSQFQLKPNGKDLMLSFCRFEKSSDGISINKAMSLLDTLGMKRENLVEALDQVGYAQGNSSLNQAYNILEMRLYRVDSVFPVITSESFIGGKIPDGISKIQYTVNLEGLTYTPLSPLI
jgi:hypothetical protein